MFFFFAKICQSVLEKKMFTGRPFYFSFELEFLIPKDAKWFWRKRFFKCYQSIFTVYILSALEKK